MFDTVRYKKNRTSEYLNYSKHKISVNLIKTLPIEITFVILFECCMRKGYSIHREHMTGLHCEYPKHVVLFYEYGDSRPTVIYLKMSEANI